MLSRPRLQTSIDYAVMEQLGERLEHLRRRGRAALRRGLVRRRPVGRDLEAIPPKDGTGNVARGRVMFQGATSTYAHSGRPL